MKRRSGQFGAERSRGTFAFSGSRRNRPASCSTRKAWSSCSQSAGEIMKRIDGQVTVDALIRSLEGAFPGADLRADVIDFLEEAHESGWISVGQ